MEMCLKFIVMFIQFVDFYVFDIHSCDVFIYTYLCMRSLSAGVLISLHRWSVYMVH